MSGRRGCIFVSKQRVSKWDERRSFSDEAPASHELVWFSLPQLHSHITRRHEAFSFKSEVGVGALDANLGAPASGHIQ